MKMDLSSVSHTAEMVTCDHKGHMYYILVVSTNVHFPIALKRHLLQNLLNKWKVFCVISCLPREFPSPTSDTAFAHCLLSLCCNCMSLTACGFYCWMQYFLIGKSNVSISMTFSVMNYGTETWSVYTNTSFLFHGSTKQELLLSLLEGDCNCITLFLFPKIFIPLFMA